MNNNGGGNNYSGMNFGGMNRCRRAFFDKRSELHADHDEAMEELVFSKRAPHNGRGGIPRDGGRGRGGGGRDNGGRGGWTRISNATRITRNTVTQSNNQGIVAGSGVVCKRETQELDLERRELLAGVDTLDALGGISKRDVDMDREILATRELGRQALALERREAEQGELRKRTYDSEEATFLRRDVTDVLEQHARALGFAL